MLSNLETDAEKLLQIVLIGQPELIQTLKRTELRQLAQRVERHDTLTPFTAAESLSYIRYRLDHATPHPEAIFSQEAEQSLIQVAAGKPRVLNTLCASALAQGARQREKPISALTVKHVMGQRADRSMALPSSQHLVYGLGTAAALGLGLLWFSWLRPAVTAKTPSVASTNLVHEALPAVSPPLVAPTVVSIADIERVTRSEPTTPTDRTLPSDRVSPKRAHPRPSESLQTQDAQDQMHLLPVETPSPAT